MASLKETLKLTYQKRNSLNSSYSKNAFARDLGISPAALSQYLSNKRSLAPKNVARIIQALSLPPEILRKYTKDDARNSKAIELKIETFSVIAEWFHYGILNLVEVDQISSANQISKRLGISKESAQLAIKRLVNLKLLQKKNGFYSRMQDSLNAVTTVPSEALRKHNREKMELAIDSLEQVAINERDISSITVPFDPECIDAVRKQIGRFKDKIKKIGHSGSPSEVYSLNVQFFPLSKKGSQK
jgi:uncharacterized protein (TIGR02147 family)